ncbi:2OG-Fe(II) oxygenase [Yunchengibacter salinarum]|uniref:2OG-Fe(II) oxygenase n=1 Tax=Yunchengibacter salinarum TaxID=3133399 RepID=UPI0035B67880
MTETRPLIAARPFMPPGLQGTQGTGPGAPLSPYGAAHVLDASECMALIRLMDTAETRAGGLSGGRADSRIRQADSLWLDGDGPIPGLSARLARLVAAANRDWFMFDLDGMDEGIQLIRYRAGAEPAPEQATTEGDHYDWHVDVGRAGLARGRKLSLSLQLPHPSAYDGGQLLLNMAGYPSAAPTGQGAATLFPAYSPHAVTPVTRGVRHALVTWVQGPPFR